MIPELGNFGLYLSCFLAFFSASKFCYQPILGRLSSIKLIVTSQIALFFLTSLSLGCLIYSYIISDFSLLNVYYNSHTFKPLIYKITGSWGNHEGSLLLWLWLFSLINLLFLTYCKLSLIKKSIVLEIQSLIFALFSSFVIITSNPFWRLFPVPENGKGLNPLLQDIGLALHPPMLYTGYVLLSIPFSFSLMILIEKEKDFKKLGALLKPWISLSWSFLTLGIGLGSWWAYRELGWGGFWFWDPVENASLMPWLTCTALIHCITVTVTNNKFQILTLILSITSFLLVLLSTFIVRSGIIQSVHNFTSDSTRGLFILVILSIAALGSLSLFSARFKYFESRNSVHLFSRESFILGNNILLLAALSSIMLGVFYPVIYQTLGNTSISVGEPYYIGTFIPLFLLIVLMAAIGVNLKWQQDNIRKIILPVSGFGLFFILTKVILSWSISASLGLSCGLILLTSLWKFRNKILNKYFPTFLGHLALAILTISITILTVYEKEITISLEEKISIKFASFKMTLKNITSSNKDNYFYIKANLYVEKENGDEIGYLTPEIRYYPIEKTQTSESSIYSHLFYDLYAVSSWSNNQKILLKVYFKPMINWVWASVLLLFCSGLITSYRSFKRYEI